jgi:hypothetical protein
MTRWLLSAAAAVLLAAAPARAQELQVDATMSLPGDARGVARFSERIEPGDARVSGVARNLRGGAVQVDLVFRYRLPPDTIAFDEVIERIELTTETPQGDVFLASTLDTQLIPLNPNRTELRYRATLYHPEEPGDYVLRVRVFGNYE